MTLFQEGSERGPRRRSGWILLIAALSIGLVALAALPTPYVIEQPGVVVDVLGEAEGSKVITVSGAKSYETSGNLDLLTVSVVGNRDKTPTWPQIIGAWLDPASTVVPLDEVFPPGTTTAESQAESTAMMAQSQQDAIYVALNKLGYKIPIHIYAQQVNKKSPSSGKIVAGDYIEAINGVHPKDYFELRKLIKAYDGANPLKVVVSRKGEKKSFEITPVKNDQGEWMLGIIVGFKFDFPVQVDLKLSEIGGPSGGMIFALGIYDRLTDGQLTGGKNIAGTGTIGTDGVVGAIGGIRQKMFGAQRAGAKYFLAPADNCDEVNGHIPAGIQVFRVKNFDEAITAVTAIGKNENLAKLPTCASK